MIHHTSLRPATAFFYKITDDLTYYIKYQQRRLQFAHRGFSIKMSVSIASPSLLFLMLCTVNLISGFLTTSSFAICAQLQPNSVHVFLSSSSSRREKQRFTFQSTQTQLNEKYKRGAEIYPLTNRISFTLADSFPNGIVPVMAQKILNEKGPLTSKQLEALAAGGDQRMKRSSQFEEELREGTEANGNAVAVAVASPPGRKKLYSRWRTVRVLGSAARADQEKLEISNETKGPVSLLGAKSQSQTPKLPPIIAIALVAKGVVTPSQILFSIFLSGYLIALTMISSSPRDDFDPTSLQPVLPSLPPQGHVPDLVSNPLGSAIVESSAYQNWLRFGEVFGYLLPLATIALGIANERIDIPSKFVPSFTSTTMTHVATSMFLLCCQVTTEAIAKRNLAPLPLRIFVPIAYNAVRIGPLYNWMSVGWDIMKLWEKILALGNFVYWGANLFGFLVPVASLRYMRCHFFCVEAQEVVLRKGAFS